MAKYRIRSLYSDGEMELLDETFDSYEEAEDAALYQMSCYDLGGEVLNLSNPGDYPLSDDELIYEIIED